jgi:hypothetical protein
MLAKFENTPKESDFLRPLLDPKEDRLARELQGDSDFSVDALRLSWIGRLLRVFGGGR